MKEIDYVVGIYNFFNPYPEDGDESFYYMLYLLDEKGLLEKEGAVKLFLDRFTSVEAGTKSPVNTIGPFVNLERLNQYAFALCEELNAAQVSLLSVQEYNTLLENSQQATEFHRDLLEKGNVMENIERKKKGFLSRFFS
ncbi:MAG: hypothetical protein H7177_11205 [Rhizobacter sp.]|nr:hypothetical protein [Bacteriovorax sp.]